MKVLSVGKKSIFVLLLAVFSGLLLAACGDSSGLQVGDDAPDFSLQSVDGKRVSISDYSGQAVLLYFHMAMG